YQTSAASPFTDTGAAGTAAALPTRSTISQVGIGTAAPTANLDVRGSALFRNALDTANAFQVQYSGGSNLLNADTINSKVSVSGNLIVPDLVPTSPAAAAGSNQGGTLLEPAAAAGDV